MRNLALLVLPLFLTLCANEETDPDGPAPVRVAGCLTNAITVPDVARSAEVACNPQSYAAQCEIAVAAADSSCEANCALYHKRQGEDSPTQQSPVSCSQEGTITTTVAAYDGGAQQCFLSPQTGVQTVACTVRVTGCSCDP